MVALKYELDHRIEGYSMSRPIIYLMIFINLGLDCLNTYWFSLMIRKIVSVAFSGKSFANVTSEKDE